MFVFVCSKPLKVDIGQMKSAKDSKKPSKRETLYFIYYSLLPHLRLYTTRTTMTLLGILITIVDFELVFNFKLKNRGI